MRRFRFPIAVALTSLALVLALGGFGLLTVRSALANNPWAAAATFGAHDFGPGFQLPPELQGLRDLPAAERFAHFRGVQVSLTDKDNRPLVINATPGTVTAVSATSLTLAGNDGASKTYTLNDQTVVRGTRVPGGQAAQPTPSTGDKVVVMTLNGTTTATAVMVGGPDGFGPHGGGPRGPFGPGR